MEQMNENDYCTEHEDCDMEPCSKTTAAEAKPLGDGWQGPPAPYPPELGR
jgi:hypothetical protein